MDLCSGLGRCEGPLSNRSEPQGPYGPLVHATVTGRTTELATTSAVVNSHYQLGVPAKSSAGQSVTLLLWCQCLLISCEVCVCAVQSSAAFFFFKSAGHLNPRLQLNFQCRDYTRLSDFFQDIMECRSRNPQIPCNWLLKNIVFTLLHSLPTQFSTVAHPCL